MTSSFESRSYLHSGLWWSDWEGMCSLGVERAEFFLCHSRKSIERHWTRIASVARARVSGRLGHVRIRVRWWFATRMDHRMIRRNSNHLERNDGSDATILSSIWCAYVIESSSDGHAEQDAALLLHYRWERTCRRHWFESTTSNSIPDEYLSSGPEHKRLDHRWSHSRGQCAQRDIARLRREQTRPSPSRRHGPSDGFLICEPVEMLERVAQWGNYARHQRYQCRQHPMNDISPLDGQLP